MCPSPNVQIRHHAVHHLSVIHVITPISDTRRLKKVCIAMGSSHLRSQDDVEVELGLGMQTASSVCAALPALHAEHVPRAYVQQQCPRQRAPGAVLGAGVPR